MRKPKRTSKPSKSRVIKQNDDLARAVNLRVHSNRCCRCGRSGDVYKLDWSHVFGRQAKCIRWDELNALALCFVCHHAWHENPLDAAEWFEEKYPGRKKYLQTQLNLNRRMTLTDYLTIQAQLVARLEELGENSK